MTGLMAEFPHVEALERAVDRLVQSGYTEIDAFTPYPVTALEERLGLRRSPLGLIIFPIGVAGTLFAYLVMWYTNARSYPLNVGGRPAHAPHAFVPITFETCVLFSAL